MKYNPRLHHRRSIRLKGYDYSSEGGYFVTICTHNRECLFGEVVEEKMRLNEIGQIVKEEWARTSEIRQEVGLDAFVVMPNHLHGVIIINTDPSKEMHNVGTHGPASLRRQPRSLGSIVAGFKSAATKRINAHRNSPRMPVWQNRFYEHIIRDEDDRNRIRHYILENPRRWFYDEENPSNIKSQR
ncbi:MAG: transposase [Bacteroidota bacterium]